MANPNMKTYAIIRDPLMQQLIPQGQLRPFNEGLSRQLRAQQDAIEPVAYMDAAFDAVKEATGSTAAALAATSFSPSTVIKGLRKAPYALGVVKNPGGNWIAGSIPKVVDKSKKPLERMLGTREVDDLAAAHGITKEEALRLADPYALRVNAFAQRVFPKYLQNDMATPRDPLRLMADAYSDIQAAELAKIDAKIAKVTKARDDYIRNTDKPDPVYATKSNAILNDLQQQRDILELRLPLHTRVDPPHGVDLNTYVPPRVKEARIAFGYPDNVATTRAGEAWENAADAAFSPKGTAGAFIDAEHIFSSQRNIRENPWLLTVPPDTRVNHIRTPWSLELNTITDTLYEALDPAAGLPKHLLLKPEQLDKFDLKTAVNYVADVNAWKEFKKRQAGAVNPATLNIREFADNNPEGVHISKLRLPEGADPSNVTDPGTQALMDSLKHEAKVMQHSVGGYLPASLGGYDIYGHGGWRGLTSGHAGVFSVRDAKGNPHATFEVKYTKGGLPDITQVKGVGNRRVAPEYRRFVKDFLNNPPEGIPEWGHVDDLFLAGEFNDTRALWGEADMAKIRAAGHQVDRYMMTDEVNAIGEAVWGDQWRRVR